MAFYANYLEMDTTFYIKNLSVGIFTEMWFFKMWFKIFKSQFYFLN